MISVPTCALVIALLLLGAGTEAREDLLIQTATYPANDVISVEVLPAGRAGVWFLNWHLSASPLKERIATEDSNGFKGPGLYGLCFNDRLIYVGSYLGTGRGGASFSGDVVSARWWTHVGAITARSNRLHLSESSIKALVQDPGPEHPMVKGLLSATTPDLLHKDQGNLAPLRRLRFAAQQAQTFLDPAARPDEVLSRFSFVYAQVQPVHPQQDLRKLAERIVKAEQSLISDLAPSCNTAHIPAGKEPTVTSCSAAAVLLTSRLRSPR